MKTPSQLELALADAGGAAAAPEWGARLRDVLRAELERGRRELGLPRTGRERPIVLAMAAAEAAAVVVAPVSPELRADPDAVSERAADLASAATAALSEAGGLGPPAGAGGLALRLGSHDGHLALAYPSAHPADAADYAREALADSIARIDRLRAIVHGVPSHALDLEDLRAPIGPTHPLRVAEAVARLGGSPLDEGSVDALEAPLLELLEPPGAVTRAHDDSDLRRRGMRRPSAARRQGQMGRLPHVGRPSRPRVRGKRARTGLRARRAARGGRPSDREAERRPAPRVLNPRRAGEIRRLIDDGELPPGL